MSFALDRYEPIAFHLHPELMRAAEAQTAVLRPAATTTPAPALELAVVPPAAPPAAPPPPRSTDPSPAASTAPPTTPAPPTAVPVVEVAPVSASSPAERAAAPPEPIAAYLIAMTDTSLLRASLADFLDAAGSRRDVRVSVGVATGRQVTWVLRDQVPYGVRAMPRYPDPGAAAEPDAALAAASAAVTADAAADPARRQLVVLLWDRWPDPVTPPAALRSALVLHCVDAVLMPPGGNGASAAAWILARTRPGPRPSLLAHTGRLLDRWELFGAVPPGLVLSPFDPRRA
jgi:hypothetical protein